MLRQLVPLLVPVAFFLPLHQNAPNAPAPATAGLTSTSATAVASPDHDFLRALDDQLKGLVLMVHATMHTKSTVGVKPVASRLDSEVDKTMDRIATLLDSSFKDAYTPKASSENQALADQLTGKSGADYDRTFLENVIKHHKQTIAMIDAYLPNAKMPAVRSLARQVKATDEKEVTEFRQRLQKPQG